MDYVLQAMVANALAAGMLVFLILSFPKQFGARKAEARVFSVLLLVNLVQCVLAPACIVLDGALFPGAVLLAAVLNALLYMGGIALGVLWMVYAACRMLGRWPKLTMQRLAVLAPAALALLGAVVNLFVPVYFQITPENTYLRGSLFLVPCIVGCFYLVLGAAIVYGPGSRGDRYVIRPAMAFLLPVAAAGIVQYLMPGISLLWAGAALSVMFAYVSVLDESAAIDQLSGVYTRRYLNKDLKRMRAMPQSTKLTVGIMFDIVNFSRVNEAHGYAQGDRLIRESGRILRKAAGQQGRVYRYLGGVFMITMQVEAAEEINTLVLKVDEGVKAFNGRGEAPSELGFSIGYTMLAPEDTIEEFLTRLEKAVVDNKKQERQKQSSGYRDLDEFYQFNPNRNRILIVNGKFLDREILKNIFPAQFRIVDVVDASEAMSRLDIYANSICAILIDMESPGVDGMELLEILHQRHITRIIPTFLVTENEAYDFAQQAYALGAVDVIANPFIPYVILQRVQSVLALFRARESIQAAASAQDDPETQQEVPVLEQSETLASAIEFRDDESSEHTNRIYNITKQLLSHTAMGEGLSQEDIENIALGSIMHDVGKIAISDSILNKPGRLTAEEFGIMKSHTEKGAELIAQLAKSQEHPSYRYAMDIARHHHERWDGGGYPDGLKGEEISLWAQVVSLADAYDALVSPRVYKKVFSADTAVEMICAGECGAFNPKLLECFRAVEKDFRVWYEKPLTDSQTAVRQLVHQGGIDKDMINVMLLIDAVRINHDQVIYGNLSQNTYTMMGTESFPSVKQRKSGEFDQLVRSVAARVPSSHKHRFVRTFSRDILLKNYADGIKNVSQGYPEMLEDGDLRIAFTTVLLMEDARNGDVLVIVMVRYVDQ